MPLISNFNDAGDGSVVSQSRDVRRYRVGTADDFIDYVETTTQEVREWVGLTYEAAKSQVDAAPQPAQNDSSFSYMMDEDNRIIGSYKLQRSFEQKVTTTAATAPPPTIGGITWSTANATVASFPFSVTMTSSNASDRIWYRIDGMDSSGNYVAGTFTDGGSNNVSVSANSTTIRGGAGIHKQIRILAEARRTLLTGQVYIGARSERVLTQAIPNFAAVTASSYNPSGGSSGGIPSAKGFSFPLDVTVSVPSGATKVFAQAFYTSWSGTFVNQFPMSDQGNAPAVITLNPPAFAGTSKFAGLAAFPFVIVDGVYYRENQVRFEPATPPEATSTTQRFYQNY